jgi:hypothetical protein
VNSRFSFSRSWATPVVGIARHPRHYADVHGFGAVVRLAGRSLHRDWSWTKRILSANSVCLPLHWAGIYKPGRRWDDTGMSAKGQPIDEVVSWSVDPNPVWVVAAGVGQFLVEVVFQLTSYEAPERPDALRRRRLPPTQTEPVDLAHAFVEGVADWLPPAWAGRQLVTCGLNGTTINPKGFEGSDVQIPLSRLRIADARPKTRWSRRRYATANWVLTLTDGANSVALTGPWLTLAWIGHLANWPEPLRKYGIDEGSTLGPVAPTGQRTSRRERRSKGPT